MKTQTDTVSYKNGQLTLPELRQKFQSLPVSERVHILSLIVNSTRRVFSQAELMELIELMDFLAKLSDPAVATACWEAQMKKWRWYE